ncbi:sodium-translocating pyrophosphatase [Humisphaera borealis]|uniref:K(+)-insensitive pyrophosphate-energized proton pump n=1 Tax=Humisphaera borealis TaxID=2807512 RepID=A0A7M2WUW0_9BACT|nr:sodium-translocating pyrophosphatase [Humisphaera borealis]QOV88601.1 sodium-translocating pyrophosphatase [Humisphaera borealis]
MPLPALAKGEADLVLPDFSSQKFFGQSIDGKTLLTLGLLVTLAGIAFGLVIYAQLRRLPVHRAMLEVSDLIYETCKTYLLTQAKFILILWVCIAAVMVAYFGFLRGDHTDAGTAAMLKAEGLVEYGKATQVISILAFSLVGIAGSYAVAWFGMRVNTFANSRTAMASLGGKARPVYAIPLKAGMSIGMVLISVELFIMLCILLFVPRNLAGPCFIGFAIGESLGAAALRVAGGIFTKIADIGADLMKIVFKIKEDDARNPGVIADCVGDNAGDSVGPTADGFETYGVTGVALITFILLAVANPVIQIQLLVWIFVMRLLMVVTSALSYFIAEGFSAKRYATHKLMNFEVPLTLLVWVASVTSIAATYLASYVLIGNINGNSSLWWILATIITCGTLAGAVIPEVTKIFTSTHSGHVREVVTASKEGGASLNVLSGLTAGNFSGFWVGGVTIGGLMALAYGISLIGGTETGLATIMIPQSTAIFAFGLVAFGFLGMGPVTIAVDSYGPVTDNAQSVYELSLIETHADIQDDIRKHYDTHADFEHAKGLLEENDGAGNTFKATAKPVLIGTAVVGATTLIFSIIMLLTNGLTANVDKLSILHAPFLLGIIGGVSVIYWFSGASMQAVITGAYRAVEFIKKNIKLEGVERANVEDSKKVVAICTKFAQAGMFNIFLTIFFITLAAAFVDEFFFIGFLIGIAVSGLFQAIFMANAGGAWDNAKKIVETELKAKGTPLHDACVVGDTVGDPFKDTSSVAMNPIIKFATLFGLLAVELAITLKTPDGHASPLRLVLAGSFFLIAVVFILRSFYGMKIEGSKSDD